MVRTALSSYDPDRDDYAKYGTVVSEQVPCWKMLYKAPIEYQRGLGDGDLNELILNSCQVWIEQNKVEGSKYAILKMYIV